jgi:DNA-binding transcriptional ArsR family regulator
MAPIRSDAEITVVASRIKAIGCPCRLAILHLLADGEQSVNDISRAVGCRRPGTSTHLSQLAGQRLLKSRKVANRVYYSIADARLLEILEMLGARWFASAQAGAHALPPGQATEHRSRSPK